MSSEDTLAALEKAINDHFAALWAEGGDAGETDYIPDWALVVAYQDLSEGLIQPGYSVETRKGMYAHQIKGLLSEGIDWVDALQHSRDDD